MFIKASIFPSIIQGSRIMPRDDGSILDVQKLKIQGRGFWRFWKNFLKGFLWSSKICASFLVQIAFFIYKFLKIFPKGSCFIPPSSDVFISVGQLRKKGRKIWRWFKPITLTWPSETFARGEKIWNEYFWSKKYFIFNRNIFERKSTSFCSKNYFAFG